MPKGGGQCGVHLKGQKVRSAHLGYDCYLSGPIVQKHIRCVFRRHRAPPNMTAELIEMLPSEFRWPGAAFDEAHAAIEAIYTVDVRMLRGYVAQYPGHHFGFEHFVERAERWHAAARKRGAADVQVARATEAAAPPGQQRTIRRQGVSLGAAGQPLFPGWVKHAQPLHDLDIGTDPDQLHLCLFLIYFSNNLPALRVDAYPPGVLPGKLTRLSRLHVDLVTDEHEVVEHYPGRYLGAGLNPLLLRDLLGASKITRQRRTAFDHPDVLAARERALDKERQDPKARSLQVLRESRAMQVAADPSGDPAQVFGAHLLPSGAAR